MDRIPPPLEQFLRQQVPAWNRSRKRWEVAVAGELYWFDAKAANRPVRFIETFCKLPDGRSFILEKEQREIVQCLFGWKRARDNRRRFRELFLFVASGYGKSMLGSAILLYLLFLAPSGAELYNIAADVEQARPIFQSSVDMVDQCPALADLVEVFGRSPNSLRRAIVHKQTGAFYQVLSKTVHGKHGKRIFAVAIDEEHVLEGDGRELVQTLRTMAAKHRDSLVFKFTTAGFEQDHVCFEDFQRAKAVRDGLQPSPRLLPVLYYAEDDDPWDAPATWKKANPNLGVSIEEEEVAAECEDAKAIPSRRAQFERLRCNRWTADESVWIPVDKWDDADPCKTHRILSHHFLETLLVGQECFGGLDLSTNLDLTALVRVFSPSAESVDAFAALFTFWVPKDNVENMVVNFHVDKRLYEWTAPCHCWKPGGDPLACPALVHTTPGAVIDYDFIRRHINALNEVTPFKQLAVDKYGATQIITQLTGDLGEDRVLAVPQSVAFFTPPMRELERLVLSKLIRHGGHPVARWNLQCTAAKLDANGGIRPVKVNRQKTGKRIDGIVALLNGLSRAVLDQATPEAWVTVI